MKFSVNPSGRLGARVGSITFDKCQSSSVTVQTPCSLTTTKFGQVPHLIPDVLRITDTSVDLIHASLDTQVHLQKAMRATGMSLKKLSANKSGQLYSSVESPLLDRRTGFNTNKNVSVWTSAGRHEINPDTFMELQCDVEPVVFEVLHDADVPEDASDKRIIKSITRSIKYLERCLELLPKFPRLENVSMLGALLGGSSLAHRSRAAKQLHQYEKQLGGYLLTVPQQLQPDLCQLNSCSSRVIQLCSASLEEVSSECLRVLPGAWRPLHVLKYVSKLGVDMFDSSFPCLTTERSGALVFPLETSSSPSDERIAPDVCNGEAVVETSEKISANGELVDRKVLSAYEINLADKKYAMDLNPLLKGCGCYTCQNHFSRAYIHHLVQVREMLAPLLLQVHNLHHWQRFFESVRVCVAGGNQQLASYTRRLENLELSALQSSQS